MESKRIKLVPLDSIHGEYIVKWRNDPDVSFNLFSNDTLTLDSQKRWFEVYKSSDSRKEFIIYILDDNRAIGTVGLTDIDVRNLKAELTIILGEKEYRGKGFGEEALRLILDYAFKDLMLNKIVLKVFRYNENALKLYNKSGFKLDGILRQDIYKNNQFNDVIEMSLLKEEWNKTLLIADQNFSD